jgi:hypothetical protein
MIQLRTDRLSLDLNWEMMIKILKIKQSERDAVARRKVQNHKDLT